MINGCQCLPLVKPPPATTTARGLVRSSGWNFLRCAYMVITFFFVSYNKGDWVRMELSIYGGREGEREGGRGGGSIMGEASLPRAVRRGRQEGKRWSCKASSPKHSLVCVCVWCVHARVRGVCARERACVCGVCASVCGVPAHSHVGVIGQLLEARSLLRF